MKPTLFIKDWPCGVGKTYSTLKEIVATPGRTLYAIGGRFLDRSEELTRDLGDIASGLGRRGPEVRRVSSDVTSRVAATIEDLAWSEAANRNLCVFITHEGLKSADLTVFAGRGWRLVIDEDPKAWFSGSLKLRGSHQILGQLLKLEPCGDGFSRLKARNARSLTAQIEEDDLLGAVRTLGRMVERQQVLVDAAAWSDFDQGRSRLHYASVLPLRRLMAVGRLPIFSAVTLLSGGFRESLTYKLWKAIDGADFNFKFLQPPGQAASPRAVRIGYFSEQPVSCAFLKGDDGRRLLGRLAGEVNDRCAGQALFWTANRFAEGLQLAGKRVSPGATGTNQFADHHVGCAFFSAKPASKEIKLLQRLAGEGLGRPDVVQDRELELLYQFCLRGSLRDPACSDDFQLFVLEAGQARWLAQTLQRRHPHLTPTLEAIEIAEPLAKPRKIGRPVTGRALSGAERQRNCRDRKRRSGAPAA